ncbi:SGNH/GDSL hydrolase family protein [Flavobacterium taihuense]|uniref:G-D-S-L family lipolytic protein n=1 Tax=Flavobacterium taihuense TaxID=2857508 RepID=A0ABS6XXX4_9FLAO|nr:SGNH/GDSL hydrolase family protein [Flavobacterium taihuense]MBW4361126.1 G-D-S-L family lipolytic protein [Flavobacterium taihuense]
MIKNFKWLLLVSLSFVACNNNDEDSAPVEIPITPGSASFAKYVALGDSFAAGYSDGALFKEGQANSYVNILAQQLAPAGGGAFTTPLMADNIGGLLLGGNVIAGPRLYFNGKGPVPVSGTPTTEVTNHLTGPFNNLGIPGAKSYHLIAAGYGNTAGVAIGKANPYYARFATSGTTTVLADALVQAPSFFSLFIGGNDVLGYATSGGIGVNQTGNLDPSTYGANDITDPNVFANVYSALATNLTATGAKGVVANLPYVTTLPYFTTIPFNPLTSSLLGGGSIPVGDATIAALNAQLYGPLKQALTAFGAGDRINLLSTTAANPLLISDEKLPNLSAQLTAAFTPTLGAAKAAAYGQVFGQARQATKADLVLLTTRGVIGGATGYPAPLDKFGITFPLLDKHVLIASEIAEVKVATDAYNVTIATIAESKGLAFVDSKSAMTQLATTGVRFGNYHMSAAYVTGGAFSLDGVHPSPRGYAYIANLFVNAINTKYGATLRTVDLASYQIQYPATIQ